MPRLTDQPTAAPTRKVASGVVVGGPIAVLVAWLLGQFGVDMPAEVAVALGTLVSAVVAYFTREEDTPGNPAT